MNSFHIRPTRVEAHDAEELVRRYVGERVYIRGEYLFEHTEDEHLQVTVGPAPEIEGPSDMWTYVSADEWLKEFDALFADLGERWSS